MGIEEILGLIVIKLHFLQAMLAGIDYQKLVIGDMTPEEIKRVVLPRIFELVLIAGLDPLEATLLYPDGTVQIQLQANTKPNHVVSVFVLRDGQVKTDKTIGVLPEGEPQDILLCCNDNTDTGCTRGCGCGCLLDLGYIECNRTAETRHTSCI